MLLLYILYDWPIFMSSGSNEQLQQQLEYTLQKPDCHRWWISKMQSGREEERYAIKFCFKLGKNARETYGMLQTAFGQFCMNRASYMTDQFLWVQVQMNSYSSNWNTPYKSLIVTGGEFQKCNLDVRKNDMQ